jgi:RNA polymerase sigma factor (sigma-70 family)
VTLPPFQTLLEANRQDVHRFLVAAVGREEAEDCFQETFLAALRAYPKLKRATNLRGWLLTIAHSKAMDAHRSRRRRPLPVEEVPDTAPEGRRDGEPELWERVRELPPRQRVAVLHRFVNDMTYRQIGEVMDSTEEAARQNVHTGLRTLREVWS